LAKLRVRPRAQEDLRRLAEFLRDTDPEAALETASLILDSLKVLASYPLIGRPLESERRELVIFRGRSGYLAQYSYDAARDEVVVLTIRHQREVDG